MWIHWMQAVEKMRTHGNFGEDVFDKVNPSTNLPYGYKLKKEMSHEYATVEETV